jgi:flagellar assembly protein FliH
LPNLLKTSYVNISNKDKRVIDMNALMEAKLEKMRLEEQERAQAQFVAGLHAETIGEDGEPIEGEFEGGDPAEGLFAEYEGSVEGEDAGAERPNASAFVEKANREAGSIIENANVQAQEILNDARSSAEAEAESIRSAARDEGYSAGYEEGKAEFEQAKAEFIEKEKRLEEEYARKYESVESDLVETITDIYKHIFNVELSNQRQILLHLIENTMRKTEGTRSYLIHVSADDSAFLGMQKKTLEAAATLPDSTVEIIEDISLTKNQCFIETDGGIYDCGLDTELTELTNKLRMLSYVKENREE